MTARCGVLTRDGRGPPCKNLVKGDWPCHIHGGPTGEELKRRVEAQEFHQAKERLQDSEHAITVATQAEYIHNLEHELGQCNQQLEQTTSRAGLERTLRLQAERRNQALERELKRYQNLEREKSDTRRTITFLANYKKVRRLCFKFLSSVKPQHLEIVTRAIELFKSIFQLWA